MFKQINFFALLLLLIFVSSCKKDDPTPAPVPPADIIFKATINSAAEVPTNTSTATGTATLTYNPTTKIFTAQVVYTGITVTVGHIHRGLSGTNGGVVFGFVSPIVSPIAYTSIALDATQEFELLSNAYYVNLHSAAFPGGEIRGQLIRQ